jgi:hypothetical protein
MTESETVARDPSPDPSVEPDQAPDHAADVEPEAPVEPPVVGEPPEPRWQRILTWAVLAAIVGYILVGIGSPLFGLKVFAATDMIAGIPPYDTSGLAGVQAHNTYLNDTVDATLPNSTLFGELFRQGHLALWNPYGSGGTAFGSQPNYSFLNPLTWPYLLLPGWLAPAYVKLAEIIVAIGGTFLLLRQLRLSRAAALIGGVAFSASAFMIVWTNWSQTRVTAFVPVIFWGVERLVTKRRPRDAVILGLAVAAMVLGGFPAITGYALLFAGIYLVIRTFAEHGTQWRRSVGVIAGGVAALIGAVTISAIQLLPFVSNVSGIFLQGREQLPGDHLRPVTLLTAIAPWAFGTTDPTRGPYWYLPVNLVESMSYIGAAVAVLVLVGVATPRAARAFLPRGVWTYFIVASGLGVLVVYGGGAPLAVLQKLPVLFSDNYVGRVRSVLGLLVAVLGAIGLEVLLRRVAGRAEIRRSFLATVWGALVWAGAAGAGAVLIWRGRRAAASADGGIDGAARLSWLETQVLWGLAFTAVSVLCVAVLWWAGTRRSSDGRQKFAIVAAVLVPLLVVGQALTFVVPYWPRSDKSTFYPETPVHSWLAAHLGDDRYAAGGAMFTGADSVYRLRALNGHAFIGKRFAETLDAMPGWRLGDPPTLINFQGNKQTATQPLFDRLGVKYFVTAPGAQVLGTAVPPAAGRGSVPLDVFTRLPVPGTGPLRGISLTLAAPLRPVRGPVTIRVSVQTDDVKLVGSGERTFNPLTERQIATHTGGLPAGTVITVPVPAESVAKGARLDAVVSVRNTSDNDVAFVADKAYRRPVVPSIGTVRPVDDGLKLVYAGSAVVYQRTRALPRIRWASRAVVQPDAAQRIALENAGVLASDQVVLDSAADATGTPVSTAGGSPASTGAVDVIEDGTDAVGARVRATAAGYLVVADALQNDWVATVDGKPAPLLPADHGLVAVKVPAGQHTVRIHYAMPYHNLGTWISAATVLGILAVLGAEWWWVRRRRTHGVEQTRP